MPLHEPQFIQRGRQRSFCTSKTFAWKFHQLPGDDAIPRMQTLKINSGSLNKVEEYYTNPGMQSRKNVERGCTWDEK